MYISLIVYILGASKGIPMKRVDLDGIMGRFFLSV